MEDFRSLLPYQKAFENAMLVFEMTKLFPFEEKYGLTSQIRRSSRSVCSNIGEGYRKRKYPKHFQSKYTDADMENSETIVWLDFSLACRYISAETHSSLQSKFQEVGRMLNFAIEHPEKFA